MLRTSALTALAIAGIIMSTSNASATRPERDVIRLSCPTLEGGAFCRSLVYALADIAPGKVIRTVSRGDEAPKRTRDIGIAFHLLKDGPNELVGRFDLFQLGDRKPTTGPKITVSTSIENHQLSTKELVAHARDLQLTLN